MLKCILFASALLLLLSLDLGSDARRYRDRTQRIRERQRVRQSVREHRRDREEQPDPYKDVEDDAIIIRVPRKYRHYDDIDTAADTSGGNNTYQFWPGDFQIHQIHYPIPQIPLFPQEQFPSIPQYPWGVQQPPQIHHPTPIIPPQHYPPQPQPPQHQPPQHHPPQHQPPPQAVQPIVPPPGDAGVVNPELPRIKPADKPASCGKSYVYSKDNTRIVAGAPAAHGEFPFLVALMIRGGKTQMCGGTIIDDRTILTGLTKTSSLFNIAITIFQASAADIADLTIVAGDHNLYQDGEHSAVKRRVEKLISHRFWNKRSNFNDVAMLKLTAPLPFNQFIQPICLARSVSSYAPGKQATVAGWGRTSPADGTHQVPQQTPLKITIPLVDNSHCQKTFFRVQIAEHMICAGEGTKSACLGDSGGPLMVRSDGDGGQRWEQIGVVSWGYNCVGLSVYTRVNDFQDWIEKWRSS